MERNESHEEGEVVAEELGGAERERERERGKRVDLLDSRKLSRTLLENLCPCLLLLLLILLLI